MSQFALLPREERKDLLEEASSRTSLAPLMLEKDFWVVWVLARLFEDAAISDHILFKGGTSLAKAFGILERFSEDVDLGVHPVTLGFEEQGLTAAPSKTQRGQRHQKLQLACADWVRSMLCPRLEAVITARLGTKTAGAWLDYQDGRDGWSPEVHFRYPSALDVTSDYIAKQVKLEFGSLTDQRPLGTHRVEAMIAGALSSLDLGDTATEVVALEVERSFWEKATILHAEYHRPSGRPMPDRYARHFADFAALWNHPSRARAMQRIDILGKVTVHKQHFFASSWANYQTAQPGTLRLSPPDHRLRELRADFEKMQPMFFRKPPSFQGVINAIAEAERTINGV